MKFNTFNLLCLDTHIMMWLNFGKPAIYTQVKQLESLALYTCGSQFQQKILVTEGIPSRYTVQHYLPEVKVTAKGMFINILSISCL